MTVQTQTATRFGGGGGSPPVATGLLDPHDDEDQRRRLIGEILSSLLWCFTNG